MFSTKNGYSCCFENFAAIIISLSHQLTKAQQSAVELVKLITVNPYCNEIWDKFGEDNLLFIIDNCLKSRKFRNLLFADNKAIIINRSNHIYVLELDEVLFQQYLDDNWIKTVYQLRKRLNVYITPEFLVTNINSSELIIPIKFITIF